MMTAEDVRQVLDALESGELEYWLDGGWGVDALLGEQTREHDDLDVVVRLDDAEAILAALEVLGFTLTLDDRPTRFVAGDVNDRRIDFHPLVFDEAGDGWQKGAMPGGGDARYPASGFAGEGRIGERAVHCLTAKLLVKHHQGYEPLAKDWHNVRLLCEKFGIAIPDVYGHFRE